jgi:hypothetical protein
MSVDMKIKGYAVIYPNRAITQVCTASCPTLREMQEMVGGWTECIIIPLDGDKTTDLVMNEEGLLLDLPHNPYASGLAAMRIVGPVIIFTGGLRLP